MGYINPLGEEKILNLLFKFSIPAIVGMMVNALYNIVDRMFIGRSGDLGSNGLEAITIVFPIMFILLAIAILFGIGGATLFSIRLGEKKQEEAEKALGNGFSLLIISGLVFMILGQIFLVPLLSLFGAKEEIMPYATQYMRVIFSGAVFQILSMGLNNFIRADGSPNYAMATMFLGAGTNILLDYIFIFVFKMGMSGAALATILAQLFSCIWVVSYFVGKKSRTKLKLKYMKLNFQMVIRIVSLGLPGFLLQLANSLLNAILNKSLLHYGGNVAGMGIINSIQALLVMPIIGIRQGAQPIISFNFGAKKYNRAKKAVKLAILAATIIIVVGYVVIRVFPEGIIGMFNKEPEVLEFGSYALLAWFLCAPVIGFQIIAANFFQAIGRAKSATFLTLTRQVILLIPAIIVFPKIWGINGLLYAAPFADFFSAILTGIWFYYGMKGLKEKPDEISNDIDGKVVL
ncbi:MATE family efflux transporter [Herbivorax sp. ANBcel31]|uniref:MATE family efflux transporter n=1 Tax=Herbivorax sp. ANBcel31 TaxID=3069754 RepID=UPI0027B3332E|nr:MATE family efflux transporter [Herbivorax sp. ANBcel31]MDQ2086603.1 MATE family efflux transporter [Herbivorax sp. ANBcel31]